MELGQYHGCRCPGSLYSQAISTQQPQYSLITRCYHDFRYKHLWISQFVNNDGVETIISQWNKVNTMAADVLAPCIPRPSALSSHNIHLLQDAITISGTNICESLNLLTMMGLKPLYPSGTRSIPWLPMSWLLVFPGHQHSAATIFTYYKMLSRFQVQTFVNLSIC